MNRILLHFIPRAGCPCCAARRQYAALKAACEAIERDALGTIDFWLPSFLELTGDENPDPFLNEDDEIEEPTEPMIQFRIKLHPDRVKLDADLRGYAARELLRIADELAAAANSIAEGGAA